MKALVEIISQAQATLQRLPRPVNGFEQLVFSVTLDNSLCLLDWLRCQTIYPQLYWSHRQKKETIVTCGQVCQFNNIEEAQQFMRKMNHIDLRIWGINRFDQTDEASTLGDYYILPRLEFALTDDQLTLTLNLHHQLHTDDIAQTLTVLACLLTEYHSELLPPIKILSNYQSPEKSIWTKLVARALKAIDQEQFDKVVLACKNQLILSQAIKPVEIIKESQKVNHNCYHFMLALSEHTGFIGSTPERLFYRNGMRLETEALAGTVSSGKTQEEQQQLANWLLNDKKNQHENMLVVNDIYQRLVGKIDSIDVAEAEVLSLRKVQHLCRKIKGVLPNVDDASCLTWLQQVFLGKMH